jgi:hypothetical protein
MEIVRNRCPEMVSWIECHILQVGSHRTLVDLRLKPTCGKIRTYVLIGCFLPKLGRISVDFSVRAVDMMPTFILNLAVRTYSIKLAPASARIGSAAADAV